MALDFFLRQLPVHPVDIQRSVQVIQFMADGPRLKALRVMLEGSPLPVLVSHPDMPRAGYHALAARQALKKMLAERKHDMGVMIELSVDEDTLLKRLLNRAVEQGRADDNEETIKARFAVYHAQTEPLAMWFENEGIRHTFTWKGDKDTMLGEIFAFLDNL